MAHRINPTIDIDVTVYLEESPPLPGSVAISYTGAVRIELNNKRTGKKMVMTMDAA